MLLRVHPARPSFSSLDNVNSESDWCRDGTDSTFHFCLGALEAGFCAFCLGGAGAFRFRFLGQS